MKLKEWREREKLKQVHVAAKIGCAPATISRLEAEKLRPDWDTIVRIAEVTKGEVTANDFMPEAA